MKPFFSFFLALILAFALCYAWVQRGQRIEKWESAVNRLTAGISAGYSQHARVAEGAQGGDLRELGGAIRTMHRMRDEIGEAETTLRELLQDPPRTLTPEESKTLVSLLPETKPAPLR